MDCLVRYRIPKYRNAPSRSHLDYEISSMVGRHVQFVNGIIGAYNFGGGGRRRVGNGRSRQDTSRPFMYRLYLKRLKVRNLV